MRVYKQRRSRILGRVIGCLLGVSCGMSAHAVEPNERLADPVLEQRARDISRHLRCLVCKNENIDESTAPIAETLRLLVRDRLQEGDSDQAIIDYLVGRYSAYVLLKPPLAAETVVLWLSPVLALGLCVGMAWRYGRRRPPRNSAPDMPCDRPDDDPKTSVSVHRRRYRRLALGLGVTLPTIAVLLYTVLGSPDVAPALYEPRIQALLQLTPKRVDHLEGRLRGLGRSLQTHPDDFRTLVSLAQTYQELGRYGEARRAWTRARSQGTLTTEEWSQFGESLLHTEHGQIGPEAHDAFLQALHQNRRNPRARWFLGLEAVQQGDMTRGLAIWLDLAQDSKPKAPWWRMLQDHIRDVAAQSHIDMTTITPAHPLTFQTTTDPLAAFRPEEKQQIRAMVESLKQKLTDNPEDATGWQRLGRSLTVMGISLGRRMPMKKLQICDQMIRKRN